MILSAMTNIQKALYSNLILKKQSILECLYGLLTWYTPFLKIKNDSYYSNRKKKLLQFVKPSIHNVYSCNSKVDKLHISIYDNKFGRVYVEKA